MTTTAPGPQSVKPRRVVRRELSLDDDPTEYPDSEVMCREPVENEICLQLQPVLRRYQAERGIVCYIGSDNFIYWVRGNIKACVSPDVYILPGIAQTTRPAQYVGTKDEQCWKTWIHQVVPNFALEVKARRSPRKDELQSPPRHDALGTKELIVFDPFAHRRRAPRKRFVVYRRNEADKLVIVRETNDDRVYAQELDAFLVAQNEGDHSLLRLGLGASGERLLPFESELVEMETRRASEAVHLAEQEAQRRHEEASLRKQETRRADEEARRADEETRRADEATRIAQAAAQRAAELEAELARLRAGMDKSSKRRSKSET
jgi:hypothetical protein